MRSMLNKFRSKRRSKKLKLMRMLRWKKSKSPNKSSQKKRMTKRLKAWRWKEIRKKIFMLELIKRTISMQISSKH